ncbi:MAG: hypothetical protein ABJF86_02975 [Tateyamaria sp.]|uniref:hypothetical protein n=2 Tax=Tateyamaria sp. TaxID=1929288 RepID=UPI00327BE71B
MALSRVMADGVPNGRGICSTPVRSSGEGIGFAASVGPSEDTQQESIELFVALTFVEFEADQCDRLWVRHVHEGNA